MHYDVLKKENNSPCQFHFCKGDSSILSNDEDFPTLSPSFKVTGGSHQFTIWILSYKPKQHLSILTVTGQSCQKVKQKMFLFCQEVVYMYYSA